MCPGQARGGGEALQASPEAGGDPDKAGQGPGQAPDRDRDVPGHSQLQDCGGIACRTFISDYFREHENQTSNFPSGN